MNTIETIARYIGNIGWTGKSSHIILVQEGHKSRAICMDAFTWDGTKQPTNIKKVAPTTENITCKNCMKHI